jgi:hypothetical protein
VPVYWRIFSEVYPGAMIKTVGGSLGFVPAGRSCNTNMEFTSFGNSILFILKSTGALFELVSIAIFQYIGLKANHSVF